VRWRPDDLRLPDAGEPDRHRGDLSLGLDDLHLPGPWVDETDIRPTITYLLGLRDDYEHDGRVITQILSNPNFALSQPGVTALGECYKQLNSSVGKFAADTLQADTNAIESNTPGDSEYLRVDAELRGSKSRGTGWPSRSRVNWKTRPSRTSRSSELSSRLAPAGR
jgi:hypothetical protein